MYNDLILNAYGKEFIARFTLINGEVSVEYWEDDSFLMECTFDACVSEDIIKRVVGNTLYNFMWPTFTKNHNKENKIDYS